MDLLFVYGTLLQSTNQYGLYLQNNSQCIYRGRFKGRLFDIGEYPGAVYEPKGITYVMGSVVKLIDPEKVFPTIDCYEGYLTNHPKPYEFIREQIKVECNNELVNCWVYLYNLPFMGLNHIVSGDYINYLAKKIP